MILSKFFPADPKRISPKERKHLLSCGMNWCGRCKKALPCEKFHKNQSYCILCNNISRQEYFDRYPGIEQEIINRSVEKHKEKRRAYARAYANKHKEKRRFLSKERTRLHPEYKRDYERRRRQDPLYRVKQRISGHVRRVGIIGKNGRSLKFTGTKSLEDFCAKLAVKCDDKNWFKSRDYHIDHIWQIHWFKISEENWEDVCYLVNNHGNLRPLKISENLKRKDFDFSPLLEEDFPKYQPYLKPEIAEMITDYFSSQKKCNAF